MFIENTQNIRHASEINGSGLFSEFNQEPSLKEVMNDPIFSSLLKSDDVAFSDVEMLIKNYRKSLRSA